MHKFWLRNHKDFSEKYTPMNSVLNFVMSETVDIKIKNESNLLTKKYLEEAMDQLGNKMKI